MGFLLKDAINIATFNKDMDTLVSRIETTDKFFIAFSKNFTDELARVWASEVANTQSRFMCSFMTALPLAMHKKWNEFFATLTETAQMWAEGHGSLDKAIIVKKELPVDNKTIFTLCPTNIDGVSGMNIELAKSLRDTFVTNMETYKTLISDFKSLSFGIFDSSDAINTAISDMLVYIKQNFDLMILNVQGRISDAVETEVNNTELGADRAGKIMEYKGYADQVNGIVNGVSETINNVYDLIKNSNDNSSQKVTPTESVASNQPSVSISSSSHDTTTIDGSSINTSPSINKPNIKIDDRIAFF